MTLTRYVLLLKHTSRHHRSVPKSEDVTTALKARLYVRLLGAHLCNHGFPSGVSVLVGERELIYDEHPNRDDLSSRMTTVGYHDVVYLFSR